MNPEVEPPLMNFSFLTNEIEKSEPTASFDPAVPLVVDVEHGPLRVSDDHLEWWCVFRNML